jgi:tetratricopeptide (TPR) repeat protein
MTPDVDPAAREGRPKTKVFISYSRKDLVFVDKVDAALKARGFEPLIDRSEIYAFEDWWQRIESLILQADTVVFVLSPDAVSSDICAKEVELAASLSKRFAPIVWRRVDEGAVPEALRRRNFIFFDDEVRFDTHMARLADALETDIDWIRKHTEFGALAKRWAAAGRQGRGGLLLRSPILEQSEKWLDAQPTNAPIPTADTKQFISQSRRAATRRKRMISAAAAAMVLLVAAIVVPKLYAEYAYRVALDCDKFAADVDNDVHVPGVELEKIDASVAIPTCQSAIAAHYDNPRLMFNLGRALENAGKFEEAVAWYRKAADMVLPLAQNSLGVMYVYGRGIEMDFARGVRLIKIAAEQNNAHATINYTQTDFTIIFEDNPVRTKILEQALIAKGLISSNEANGKFGTSIIVAIDKLKKSTQLSDAGISLRVLDRLDALDSLSAVIKKAEP